VIGVGLHPLPARTLIPRPVHDCRTHLKKSWTPKRRKKISNFSTRRDFRAEGGNGYVIGEVHRSGGFVLGEHQSMSVLQALSLAEGLGTGRMRGTPRFCG